MSNPETAPPPRVEQFRKKPVVIDACRWDESVRTLDALKALGLVATVWHGHANRPDECTNLHIRTLEGAMRVEPGDYIIRGVKGEFYPCKPDIFAATYEPAALTGAVAPSPQCVGYPTCDGDLEAEPHSANCPAKDHKDDQVSLGSEASGNATALRYVETPEPPHVREDYREVWRSGYRSAAEGRRICGHCEQPIDGEAVTGQWTPGGTMHAWHAQCLPLALAASSSPLIVKESPASRLRRLALEATNGWACYARTKREHAEIARLHAEIEALGVDGPYLASPGTAEPSKAEGKESR